MRKEALIGISVLLVMVSGSATVLNSFGIITGEADVESSVTVEDYTLDGNDDLESVDLRNNRDSSIEMSSFNFEVNDESLDNQNLAADGVTESIDLDSAQEVEDGDSVKLSIDGNIVDDSTQVSINGD